ncbi:tyrosine-type recombinase/integrase [Streptococcus sp. B01]|uniref:tyrosine-type recombinase/integrase n=1 Tax=unclassified Streptococcus TaxID=2608887 RepID=UPI00356B6DD3
MVKEERSYQRIHKLERDFIFVSRRGHYLSINTIDRRLKKASDKLFGVQLTAHKYRHAHVTLLAELNVPLKAVMQRVGHVDSETTLKIYTHVTEKMGNDLLNKLNQL